MKTLVLAIILFFISFRGHGQQNFLFDEVVGEKEINEDLAQTFLSEEKIVLLYLEGFGFSANEYKSLLDFEKLGKEVQIVFVSEEKGIRYVATQKYNRVVWKHIQNHTQIRNNFIAFGFGCQGYEMDWIIRSTGEWTDVFNSTHIYPLIKFAKDSLLLTKYSQCLVQNYYLPLLKYSAEGDWKLTIFYEVDGLRDREMKIMQADYLRNYFISKGVKQNQLEVRAALPPMCTTMYNPPQDYIGLNIELLN